MSEQKKTCIDYRSVSVGLQIGNLSDLMDLSQSVQPIRAGTGSGSGSGSGSGTGSGTGSGSGSGTGCGDVV